MLNKKQGSFPSEHTSKGLLATGYDNCTNLLVFIVLAEGIVELLEQRARKSIECLRTIQRNCRRVSNAIAFILPSEASSIDPMCLLRPTPGFGIDVKMYS